MALQAVAEVFPPAGCDLRPPNHHPPTPAPSFGVKHFSAAGAVMITSSHNPFNWNGVKYKASYGGSGRPAIMQAIEAELDKPVPQGSKTGTITDTDFKEPYIAAIKKFADLDKITAAGFKFLIDSMYGSGRGVLSGIFAECGINHVEIRSEANPLFPRINPEPIEPHVHEAQ